MAERRRLLAHVLGRNTAWLIAHPEYTLSEAEHAQYIDLLDRRRRGEPFAYLVGVQEFYSRSFVVSPSVLVPRPDTESVVDAVLALASREAQVVDVGTGSGAIALTVALERRDLRVLASDRCRDALRVARLNAARLGAEVVLLQADWLSAIAPAAVDVVVSNPPYLRIDDPHLDGDGVRHEPRLALAAGSDGLDAYRALLPAAHVRLRTGGWLIVEHGHTQADDLRTLLAEFGYVDVQSGRDLVGHQRYSCGRRP